VPQDRVGVGVELRENQMEREVLCTVGTAVNDRLWFEGHIDNEFKEGEHTQFDVPS
jgi:hypothetical protein